MKLEAIKAHVNNHFKSTNLLCSKQTKKDTNYISYLKPL